MHSQWVYSAKSMYVLPCLNFIYLVFSTFMNHNFYFVGSVSFSFSISSHKASTHCSLSSKRDLTVWSLFAHSSKKALSKSLEARTALHPQTAKETVYKQSYNHKSNKIFYNSTINIHWHYASLVYFMIYPWFTLYKFDMLLNREWHAQSTVLWEVCL